VASKKEAAAKTNHGKSWLIPILLSVVVAALVGGGMAWWLTRAAPPAGGEAAEAKTETEARRRPAQYLPLDPVFVVNLADEREIRYLQVEIQVMTRDPKLADDLETHMPMVRNRLLLLFSQQHSNQLRSREDKERLQAEALEEVREVLKSQAGREGIEALLFTSFVTQ
jgi:flagellar protein FliL